MTTLELFLLLKLDSIGVFFVLTSSLSIAAIIILFILIIVCKVDINDNPNDEKNTESNLSYIKLFKKITITLSIILIPLLPTTILLPTTKQMAILMVVPGIVNNEKVQELPDNILNLANEWIKELTPTKETK